MNFLPRLFILSSFYFVYYLFRFFEYLGLMFFLTFLDKKHVSTLLWILVCFLFGILSGLICLFQWSGLPVLILQFKWCCFVILLEPSVYMFCPPHFLYENYNCSVSCPHPTSQKILLEFWLYVSEICILVLEEQTSISPLSRRWVLVHVCGIEFFRRFIPVSVPDLLSELLDV